MFLQREDPLISIIYEQMNSFLTKLASKFLPISAIKAASGNFFTLKFKEKEDQSPGSNTGCIFVQHVSIIIVRRINFYWNHDKETATEVA